jgi:hypothetical protein
MEEAAFREPQIPDHLSIPIMPIDNIFAGSHPAPVRSSLPRYFMRNLMRSLSLWFDRVGTSIALLFERGHSATVLRTTTRRCRMFCEICREDTPHEEIGENGLGWYTGVSRCCQCGKEAMMFTILPY